MPRGGGGSGAARARVGPDCLPLTASPSRCTTSSERPRSGASSGRGRRPASLSAKDSWRRTPAERAWGALAAASSLEEAVAAAVLVQESRAGRRGGEEGRVRRDQPGGARDGAHSHEHVGPLHQRHTAGRASAGAHAGCAPVQPSPPHPAGGVGAGPHDRCGLHGAGGPLLPGPGQGSGDRERRHPRLHRQPLSAALWREAIDLVRTGVATVEEVDRAVRSGPGLRWAAMGPHLTYHLGGGGAGIRGHVAHLAATKEGMLRDLATWTSFPANTAELLAEGLEAETRGRSLEEMEARRDETLAALLVAASGGGRSAPTRSDLGWRRWGETRCRCSRRCCPRR